MTPNLAQRIPGHFLGHDLSQTPYVIEHLVTSRPTLPTAQPISADYHQAWTYFRERSGMIEAHLLERLQHLLDNGRDAIEAVHYLTRNILSALRLGDLNFIGSNLAWIEGMMVNHSLPVDDLRDFLSNYRAAATLYLTAAPGRLVLDWLEQISSAPEAHPPAFSGE